MAEFDEFDERRIRDRQRLIDHLIYLTLPPWWVIDQLVEAIALAAADENEAWIEGSP
jgi:hypothetical protein